MNRLQAGFRRLEEVALRSPGSRGEPVAVEPRSA